MPIISYQMAFVDNAFRLSFAALDRFGRDEVHVDGEPEHRLEAVDELFLAAFLMPVFRSL